MGSYAASVLVSKGIILNIIRVLLRAGSRGQRFLLWFQSMNRLERWQGGRFTLYSLPG
jgi:hypothetical protein